MSSRVFPSLALSLARGVRAECKGAAVQREGAVVRVVLGGK